MHGRGRELLGCGALHVDPGVPLFRGGDERLRGVDRRHGVGPSRVTSSVVSAPGPEPTSSTR